MMTSRSCGGVARAGPRRATSDPSSCRSTRHSTSSPPRASSGSVLNLQSVTKRANSSLKEVPDTLDHYSCPSVQGSQNERAFHDSQCGFPTIFECILQRELLSSFGNCKRFGLVLLAPLNLFDQVTEIVLHRYKMAPLFYLTVKPLLKRRLHLQDTSPQQKLFEKAPRVCHSVNVD